MPTELDLWKKFHTNGLAADYSDTLQSFWSLAMEKKTPYEYHSLPASETDALYELKHRSLRLYAYANRCVSLLCQKFPLSDACFALFDADAYLLKFFGDCTFIHELQMSGIRRLSHWSMDVIGPNAVSIGIAEGRDYETSGHENYSYPLINYAVYFSPCITEKEGESPQTIGGIALITPVDKKDKCYSMLCASLTFDINLHLFMSDTELAAYSNDEKCVMNIDYNIKTGKKHIIYHDSNLFNILSIPKRNLFFVPLEQIFRRVPTNTEFWKIIEKRKAVANQFIDLDTGAAKERFQISTEPYYRPNLAICGMRMFIISPRFLSAKISGNIGNTAVTTFKDLKGSSSTFLTVKQKAQIFSQTESNIFITGDIGTGKSAFAQAIHNGGSRSSGPFITLNCASFSKTQMRREMFGSEESKTHRITNIGRLELAAGGTLYLSMLGALPIELQTELLNTLETGMFTREGGTTPVKFDARIISSSRATPHSLLLNHRFRPDLYYTLCTLSFHLPLLKDRRRDIPILADYFLANSSSNRNHTKRFSPESKKLLQKYDWVGNIKELQNIVDSVSLLSSADFIEPEQIIECIPGSYESKTDYLPSVSGKMKVTKDEIISALQLSHYNKQRAAQELGISRRSLYRYLEKYGISL